MAAALDGIAKLRGRAASVSVSGNREFNPGWHLALDLSNLLTVAEAIVRSALERPESRGAHFREDFEAKDDALAKVNTVISKHADGTMRIRREEKPKLSSELAQIIEEMQ